MSGAEPPAGYVAATPHGATAAAAAGRASHVGQRLPAHRDSGSVVVEVGDEAMGLPPAVGPMPPGPRRLKPATWWPPAAPTTGPAALQPLKSRPAGGAASRNPWKKFKRSSPVWPRGVYRGVAGVLLLLVLWYVVMPSDPETPSPPPTPAPPLVELVRRALVRDGDKLKQLVPLAHDLLMTRQVHAGGDQWACVALAAPVQGGAAAKHAVRQRLAAWRPATTPIAAHTTALAHLGGARHDLGSTRGLSQAEQRLVTRGTERDASTIASAFSALSKAAYARLLRSGAMDAAPGGDGHGAGDAADVGGADGPSTYTYMVSHDVLGVRAGANVVSHICQIRNNVPVSDPAGLNDGPYAVPDCRAVYCKGLEDETLVKSGDGDDLLRNMKLEHMFVALSDVAVQQLLKEYAVLSWGGGTAVASSAVAPQVSSSTQDPALAQLQTWSAACHAWVARSVMLEGFPRSAGAEAAGNSPLGKWTLTSHVTSRLNADAHLSCYADRDIVSNTLITDGQWEEEITDNLMKALEVFRSKVKQVAALLTARVATDTKLRNVARQYMEQHSGAADARTDVLYTSAFTAKDTRLFDIGANLGAMSITAWRRGYTTDMFEALTHNVRMLQFAQCVNEQRNHTVFHTEQRALMAHQLTLHAVALGPPASAPGAQRQCLIVSSYRNKGDAIIQCDEERVRAAKANAAAGRPNERATLGGAAGDAPKPDYEVRGVVDMVTLDDRLRDVDLVNTAMRWRFAALYEAFPAALDAASPLQWQSLEALDANTPTETLLSFLAFSHVVMKIDVEGFEPQVLKGAAGLLADRQRRPRIIICEVWASIDFKAFAAMMMGTHGYLAYHLTTKVWITEAPSRLTVWRQSLSNVIWVDPRVRSLVDSIVS